MKDENEDSGCSIKSLVIDQEKVCKDERESVDSHKMRGIVMEYQFHNEDIGSYKQNGSAVHVDKR